MDGAEGSEAARWSKTHKTILSSDCSLQLDYLSLIHISVELFPVLCGSAYKDKGVQPMLDAVIDFLPAPTDIPSIKGIDEDGLSLIHI